MRGPHNIEFEQMREAVVGGRCGLLEQDDWIAFGRAAQFIVMFHREWPVQALVRAIALKNRVLNKLFSEFDVL